jgi:hypothetical protein
LAAFDQTKSIHKNAVVQAEESSCALLVVGGATDTVPWISPGNHAGTVSVTQQGHVKLKVRWADPLGGSGNDVFHSPAPDLLHIDSTIVLKSGQTIFWRQVYHRRR